MEADSANGGKSIADVAKQCRAALKTCLNILPLNEDYWAEARLTEFQNWASTAGAFDAKKVSLDSELVFEPDTKNIIVDLLKTLRNCIQECQKSDDKEVDRDGADIAGSEDQQDLPPTDDVEVTSPTASLFSSWSDDSDVSSSKS
ncbi:hypothetical protein E5D57_003659 [Metarhizium anisopliae]|nr:hypothetical protein E5D57_003659 [Metarhizium anisopliae]